MEYDGVSAWWDEAIAFVNWDECNTTVYFAEEGRETYYDFRGEDCNNDVVYYDDVLDYYVEFVARISEQYGELIECDAAGVCKMEFDVISATWDGVTASVSWDGCNVNTAFANGDAWTYTEGEDCFNDDDVTSQTMEGMTYADAEDMVWEQFGELIECDAAGVCSMEKDGVNATWDGVTASISWDGCTVNTIYANGDESTSRNVCEDEGQLP